MILAFSGCFCALKMQIIKLHSDEFIFFLNQRLFRCASLHTMVCTLILRKNLKRSKKKSFALIELLIANLVAVYSISAF